jgi:hypothetical protein
MSPLHRFARQSADLAGWEETFFAKTKEEDTSFITPKERHVRMDFRREMP